MSIRNLEYLVVRSDLERRGLGQLLMNKLIADCRKRGTGETVGAALSQDVALINLARQLGFDVRPMDNDQTIQRRLVPTASGS